MPPGPKGQTQVTGRGGKPCAEARRAAPQECCGLMGGKGWRIKTLYPLRNVAANPLVAYEAAAEELFAAQRLMRERGEELVADLKSRVRRATAGIDASGVGIMYWFANSTSPYMAGCCGAPGVMTRAVGAENAMDDTHEEWPQVG